MSYYEDANVIQEKLLGYMSDDYSKIKGTWLWEILKAIACELSDLTAELDTAANILLAKNQQGDNLEDYVNNWSYITKKKMAQASGYCTFTAKSGRTGVVPQGAYVGTGVVNYITTEDGEITESGGTCTIPVVCAEWGNTGNCDVGAINRLVTSIDFVDTVYNYSNITGGEDEESDESLLSRYYEAMKKAANAGNKAYYEEIAKSVEGVGNAYCVPCPNNVAGTADIYIVNSERQQVSSDVINTVQNIIDPNINGDGSGEAPVGAIVTVKTPDILQINFNIDIFLESGYSLESVKAEIRANIESYLDNAFNEKILRFHEVCAIVINTTGVKDYNEIQINGGGSDITIIDEIYIFAINDFNVTDVV